MRSNIRLGSVPDQGEYLIAGGGHYVLELLFGEASRADCAPRAPQSQERSEFLSRLLRNVPIVNSLEMSPF